MISCSTLHIHIHTYTYRLSLMSLKGAVPCRPLCLKNHHQLHVQAIELRTPPQSMQHNLLQIEVGLVYSSWGVVACHAFHMSRCRSQMTMKHFNTCASLTWRTLNTRWTQLNSLTVPPAGYSFTCRTFCCQLAGNTIPPCGSCKGEGQ